MRRGRESGFAKSTERGSANPARERSPPTRTADLRPSRERKIIAAEARGRNVPRQTPPRGEYTAAPSPGGYALLGGVRNENPRQWKERGLLDFLGEAEIRVQKENPPPTEG